MPGLPLVTSGPYRWLRHPNYVAVVAEGIALPLVHTAWITALVFTVLNAWLLAVRIRIENTALAEGLAMQAAGPPAPADAMSIDLLVAGAGPAGLATALHAVRGGLERRPSWTHARARSTRHAARG